MKPHQTTSLFVLTSLSIVTSPFIFSLLILRIWGQWLQEMGLVSEEVFRAQQLPILNFPDRSSSNSSNHPT